MREHPLAAEFRVWITDPENWQWQTRYRPTHGWVNSSQPPSHRNSSDFWRLVWRPWYDEPGEWEWSCRLVAHEPFCWGPFCRSAGPAWNHSQYEYQFRRKKRPLTIPERTIPMPLREEPEHGAAVWVSDNTILNWVGETKWRGLDYQRMWLKRGLLYDTKADATAAAKAMLPFGGEE